MPGQAGVSLLSERLLGWFDDGMGVRRGLFRVLAAAAVLSVSGAAVAYAEAADATGWWWRAQTGRGPSLPAPPNVPEESLFVMSDPSGEQAIAAVAVQRPDAVVTDLIFEVSDRRGTAQLVACPAKGKWEPAAAGPWAERPTPDCELASVAGVIADDGATVTFPLTGTGLGDDGSVDMVITGASGATFSAVLSASDGGPIVTRPAAPTAAPTAPASEEEPSFPAETPSAAPAGGFDDDASFPSGGFAAPIGGVAAGDLEDPTEDIAASAPTPVRPAAGVEVEPFSGERAPLALVAAALVVGAWVLRSRAAVAGSASHPLAGPLVFAGDGGLEGAQGLLAQSELDARERVAK